MNLNKICVRSLYLNVQCRLRTFNNTFNIIKQTRHEMQFLVANEKFIIKSCRCKAETKLLRVSTKTRARVDLTRRVCLSGINFSLPHSFIFLTFSFLFLLIFRFVFNSFSFFRRKFFISARWKIKFEFCKLNFAIFHLQGRKGFGC
jgi:hypothetical protein